MSNVNDQSVFKEKIHFENTQFDRIAFIHIPKVAGSSIHQYFEATYGTDRVIWYSSNVFREMTESQLKVQVKELAQFSVIGGHIPLMSTETMHYLSGKTLFVTIIREPIERLISHFYYIQERSNHHQYNNIIPDDLVGSIKYSKKFRDYLSNIQCRFIGGSRNFEKVQQQINTNPIIIGKLEKLQEFMSVLNSITQNNTVKLPYLNMASNKVDKTKELEKENFKNKLDSNIIEELIGEDIKLYNNFKTIFLHSRN